jgi:YD repeat-containing protein
LEIKQAEPKKITISVYNGQPDPRAGNATASCAPTTALLPDGSRIAVLCKKVEQGTTDATGSLGFSATVTGTPRTWTYTYNQYGQVLTARDPLSKQTTYAYYSDTTDQHTMGDLQSVIDSAGRITQYTRYDKSGRLMQSVDANGTVTDTTYTPRGWVKTVTVTVPGAAAQASLYDYDGVGQLKKATLPDGSALEYTYDAAHRLTSVKDAAGNSVTYTLDNMGNRTGEDLKDPNGTLARNITRVYDALNRAQSTTGTAP